MVLKIITTFFEVKSKNKKIFFLFSIKDNFGISIFNVRLRRKKGEDMKVINPPHVLKKIRKILKLSQADLAQFFGVSQSLLAQVEKGKRTFSRRKFTHFDQISNIIDMLNLIHSSAMAAQSIFRFINTDVYLPSSLFNLNLDSDLIDIYTLSQILENLLKDNIRTFLLKHDFKSIQKSLSNFQKKDVLVNLEILSRYNFTSPCKYTYEYPDKVACISVELKHDVDYPLSTSGLDMYFNLDVFIEDQIACVLKGNREFFTQLIFQFYYNIISSSIIVEPDRLGILCKNGIFYSFFSTDILNSFFSFFLKKLNLVLPFQKKK
jgi:transcriptional regulator with XRE-family HTH domain